MDETLFYAFGIALVLSALALSALGLRSQRFPPSRVVLAGVVAYFVALVGATSTFAVLNARDEQRKRDAEHAEAPATVPAGGEQTTTTGATTTTKAGGETVKVSSPADGLLVFEPSKLTAKAGSVTIDYDNPSPVDHSVAIEAGSETLAESEIAADATLTATADLEPGEFVFYCTVPGHREAGMVGTLTVK
ncbi:MAG: plastocyanin/azurin family copper-binding protein [Actinomycetota bacterium]